MSPKPDQKLLSASNNLAATEKELAAAVLMFEAAAFRGETYGLTETTERAHAALQARLDAFAGLYGLAKKTAGEG